VDADRYPLFAIKSLEWVDGRKTVLVTGGVHGYETSGVQGALQFVSTKAEQYVSNGLRPPILGGRPPLTTNNHEYVDYFPSF
jgi:succinylglutamate desuccinylase